MEIKDISNKKYHECDICLSKEGKIVEVRGSGFSVISLCSNCIKELAKAVEDI